MRKILLLERKAIPLLLAFIFFIIGVGIGQAYTLWGPKWPNANPHYVFDDSFKNSGIGWNNKGETAISDWNSISGTPFRFTPIGGEGDNHIGAGILLTGCSYLAETSRVSHYGVITSFTIVINTQCGYAFYDGTQAPSLPTNYYDLKAVVTHELGHGMGLCHSGNSNAVMWTYVPVGTLRPLIKDDKQGNRKLYSSTYAGPGPEGSCIP